MAPHHRPTSTCLLNRLAPQVTDDTWHLTPAPTLAATVGALVDDHSRLAYCEILPDEKGVTAAGFITRAAGFLAGHGITRIKAVMTDNHWSYTKSQDFADAITALGAKHIRIKPHSPPQNGKVERFNQTLQNEWAYRQAFTNNNQRTTALQPWLHNYNHTQRHGALHRHPPTSRLSPT